MVKNLSATQETWVQTSGQKDALEKGMTTNSSILAWRIPWMRNPVNYSPWGHKESYMVSDFHFHREIIDENDWRLATKMFHN